MAELRPRGMSQGEFAELLRGAGFPSCSKAAVSLAERPKESGVQFSAEARNAARELLNSTSDTPAVVSGRYGRQENRKNGRKTTVWFDEDTRSWLETRAYMEDSCVGEIVRRIVAEARARTDVGDSGYILTRETDVPQPKPVRLTAEQRDSISEYYSGISERAIKKAASDAATSEAAED